jgi:hypothetical protein
LICSITHSRTFRPHSLAVWSIHRV